MRKSCGYNRDVIDIVSDDNQSVSLKADFKSIENHNEEDLDNDNESIGSSVLENHFGPDIKSLPKSIIGKYIFYYNHYY